MKDAPLKISLILCTVKIIPEIKLLMDSLASQHECNFELIVVDQSSDNQIEDLITKYKNLMDINYQGVDFKGLSKSRNHGIQHAKGNIIGFPDDDCWYEHKALHNISEFFQSNSDTDFVSIKTITEPNSKFSINNSSNNKSYILPLNTKTCSITLFARSALITNTQGFDVRLGAGTHTPFKASEEEDLIYRAIQEGFFGFYYPIAEVYHPLKGEDFNMASARRWIDYSCGKMACQLKNRKLVGNTIIAARIIYCILKPIATVYSPKKSVKALFEALGIAKAIYSFKKYY